MDSLWNRMQKLQPNNIIENSFTPFKKKTSLAFHWLQKKHHLRGAMSHEDCDSWRYFLGASGGKA